MTTAPLPIQPITEPDTGIRWIGPRRAIDHVSAETQPILKQARHRARLTRAGWRTRTIRASCYVMFIALVAAAIGRATMPAWVLLPLLLIVAAWTAVYITWRVIAILDNARSISHVIDSVRRSNTPGGDQ